MKTDKPGYDPDFYPTFFDKTRVFRDVVGYLPPVGDTADFTPVLDGWTDTGVNPAPEADVGTFCDRWATYFVKRGSCFTCLSGKGYWFDGSYLKNSTEDWRGPQCSSTAWCAARGFGMCIKDTGGEKKLSETSSSGRCRIPQVWFTGNHLNFHPPKFIVARKVIKDVLAGVKLFRLGFFTLDPAGAGAVEMNQLNPPCNLFGGRSSFFNNRNAVRQSIDNTTQVKFGGDASLSEALLDLAISTRPSRSTGSPRRTTTRASRSRPRTTARSASDARRARSSSSPTALRPTTGACRGTTSRTARR